LELEQKAGVVIYLVIKLAIGKPSRRNSSEQVPHLDYTLTRMTQQRLPTFDIPFCWPWLRPWWMNRWWQVSST